MATNDGCHSWVMGPLGFSVLFTLFLCRLVILMMMKKMMVVMVRERGGKAQTLSLTWL